ncbi:DUF11 domain-containing protein [Desulfatibacillum aliphaticivorans]|nr:DUF11 domain-containing protein [Desulfatibacillum aliphaticivorans]
MAIFAVITLTTGAWALGTDAGTIVTNTATATYGLGDVTGITKTASDTFTVAELINFTVVAQNSPLSVTPDSDDQAITYLITNTGNSTEDFILSAVSGIAALGGDFNPTIISMYQDNDGTGAWDPVVDIVNLNDGDRVTIPEDGTLYIHVSNTIPAVDPLGVSPLMEDGDEGYTELTVQSATHADNGGLETDIAGTVIADGYAAGVDAVIAVAGGQEAVVGTYVVQNIVLSLTKTSAIVDTFGGSQPLPGATVTYTIVADVTFGTGTAKGVVVTDNIPAGTTYVAGTLKLNTVAYAGPGGYIGATDSISVTLGDMSTATASQTIEFQVTIDAN